MPTDSPFPPDPQTASLAATLGRVRRRRRLRTSAAGAALLLAGALLLHLAQPVAPPRPGPEHLVENSGPTFSSRPLAPGERLLTTPAPGLRISTDKNLASSLIVRTPAGSPTPRIDEEAFRQLLVANQVFCLQVNGGPARVLPLQP